MTQETTLGCKVTYIGHSGFFVEWEDCCFLFDYYTGALPEPKDKPLIVFSSHSHEDHFNPEIFAYGAGWKEAFYVLSDDISPDQVPEQTESVFFIAPDAELTLPPEIYISTLKSTDLGVAFFVRHKGKTLYHAGDLQWWLWHECTQEENQEMTERFQAELAKCPNVKVDLAFLPLDPRQMSYAWMGMDAYMRQWDIQRAFPMHFGRVFAIIPKMKKRISSADYADKILSIQRAGQEYQL
jgi:L-ascorbate metabolism protein UlaG (beta-lactamase superfamily)